MNPACTSHIDSRTGLWQGTPCRDWCCGRDGVVPEADANAARNRCDKGIALYTSCKAVKTRLLDQSGTPVGTTCPGLEPAVPTH